MIRLLSGDCRSVLPTLPADSVQCVVTSPPYYGLRDYGTALWDGGASDCDHTAKQPKRGNAAYTNGQGGSFSSNLQAWGDRDVSTVYRDTCGKCGAVRIDRQIGLERDPSEYLATMVQVFREIRRVLRSDGTVWCNVGDSYAGGKQGRADTGPDDLARRAARYGTGTGAATGPREFRQNAVPDGLAAKQLLLMPARLALALQADGWWVRSDIIWHKPNPMPESCTDRPTSSYEHVFLLTKSARYFYDNAAVAEQVTGNAHSRGNGVTPKSADPGSGIKANASYHAQINELVTSRSCRNVWTIATEAFPSAHFATYPSALAERCIRAGTRFGDTVLDPFAGAGTTALVSARLQRDCIGIDLNTAYTEMAMERCRADAPLFADLAPVPVHPVETEIADLFAEAAE